MSSTSIDYRVLLTTITPTPAPTKDGGSTPYSTTALDAHSADVQQAICWIVLHQPGERTLDAAETIAKAISDNTYTEFSKFPHAQREIENARDQAAYWVTWSKLTPGEATDLQRYAILNRIPVDSLNELDVENELKPAARKAVANLSLDSAERENTPALTKLLGAAHKGQITNLAKQSEL